MNRVPSRRAPPLAVLAAVLVSGRYWPAGTFAPAPPTELLGPLAWLQPAGG